MMRRGAGARASRWGAPFDWLPRRAQTRAFAALFALSIGLMLALNAVGLPLISEAAPLGIVSFELAGDLSTARAMLGSWGESARVAAGLSLGLDYLFLVAYSTSLALGCALVARRLDRRFGSLAALGAPLAWAQLAAAPLDAVENVALIRLLVGSEAPIWPVVALWCALPKFGLVAAGLLYVLVGLALWRAAREDPG